MSIRQMIRKYPYLILLTLSFLVVGVADNKGFFPEKIQEMPIDQELPEEDAQENVLPAPPEEPVETEETAEPEESEETVNEPKIYTADRSYFKDALFVGDSRTVGLYQYGDLGEATVLADTGMSVYKLLKKEFPLSDGTKKTFEDLLAERQFQKIYLMLGINELGYDFGQTVSKYRGMVEMIEDYQPEALIFIEANLHITEKKSAGADIYNNENINRFNEATKEIAEEKGLFYLDVNPLFDDENGSLSVEYTVDESHVLGKYYKDWVDWILSNAVEILPAEQASE